MGNNRCFHCGDEYDSDGIVFDSKNFCCNGCKTVYEIFSDNDLAYYYELEQGAGSSPDFHSHKYDFLKDEKLVAELLEFDDQGRQVVNLRIPKIHCSSCIWVLENLNKLNAFIYGSEVDFPNRTVRINYASDKISLRELVLLLAKIGYEPNITLDDYKKQKNSVDRSLVYKLGIAGFAFGNVMFLSFPEYFQEQEFWLDKYKYLFRWLMFFFSLPVVLYSASDYFVSAYRGLRSKILNIDVPIALGILVIFVRSTLEITFDWGTGFFDSLTGLVFFLLLGKFFQQKTYSFLSFERDYRSYFPIAATRIMTDGKEVATQVYDIRQGDRLLIRNEELIPVDGILISSKALIDYSFVTGESRPQQRKSGDRIFAAGNKSRERLRWSPKNRFPRVI